MKAPLKFTFLVLCISTLACSKEPLQTPGSKTISTSNQLKATASSHYIGERFGGGVVFYVTKNGLHGLIADTIDLGFLPWWNGTYVTTGATDTSLFTGKINTRKIVFAQGRTENYAALACANSTNSGFTDWYLPSKNELSLMYLVKHKIGGFVNYIYWSSSEFDNGTAWRQNFGKITFQHNDYKPAVSYVRAIRSF